MNSSAASHKRSQQSNNAVYFRLTLGVTALLTFFLHYTTKPVFVISQQLTKAVIHNKLVCFGLTLDVELILTFFLHYTNSIHYLPTVNKSSIHNNNINRSTEEVENSWLFALCDCANLRCLCWKTEHPWVLHNVLLNFEKSLFVE